LQFDGAEHQKIKEAAEVAKLSMKDFIKDAIKEKIERQK
jgi:hypothetical protein